MEKKGYIVKNILVIEDDRFLGNAYKIKLEKAGFKAVVAADAKEAFKTLDEFTPDLILLDLILPVKDGFAILQDFQDNEKLQKIPVIVVSNLSQQEDMEKAKTLGAIAFFTKTNVTLENLVDHINQAIKNLK